MVKLRRATEARDPADELDRIRRELPRAERDLAAVEARVAAHEQREAELVERGVDSYLDGQDEALVQRERAEFDAAKVNDLRELERLRLVVERLRSRGGAIVEDNFREQEQARDEALTDLRRQHDAAVANVARLQRAIAANQDRFDMERSKLDALAEFSGKRRDWAAEDLAEIRRWVDLTLRGHADQILTGPPPHLRERIERAVEAARAPARREAAARQEREELLASGNYLAWPSGDPFPVPLDPERRL
jgi:hypothetical protein